MDKIKINNQVVSMRKFVKQAKTRVINKCVKEIKLLQNRKGNENQVLKCKRKAERLLLEVSILKKIKPDSVSKMALSKAKDWKAILARKNVPLEDRCFAILANYEPVQKEVEKFHSDNSYLVSKIATLVEEWEEKSKLISQSPQRNKKNIKNDSKVSELNAKKTEVNLNLRDVPNVENKPEIKNTQENNLQHMIIRKPLEKETIDTGRNDSDLSSEDAEGPMEGNEIFPENDYLNSTDSQKMPDVSKDKIIESSLNPCVANTSSECESSSEDDEFDDSSELEDEEDNYSRSPQESFDSVNSKLPALESKLLKVEAVKNNPSHPKISSVKLNVNINKLSTFKKNSSAESNSTKAVALLNLNEMLDLDEIPIDNSRATVETIESGKRKRDTFFLNDNGEDFSESDNNEDSDDGKQESNHSPYRKKQHTDFNRKDSYNERFKNDHNSFKNNRNFGNSPHAQKFGFQEKSFNKSSRGFHSKEIPNKFGKNQGRQENNFNKNRFNSFEKSEGGQGNHFSRKWNTTDKNNRVEQKPFKNSSGKTFEKNTTNNKSKNDNYLRNKLESKAGKKEELPLHPSWEAKRKLKAPVKAKFQGKRTVFRD